MKIKMMEKVSKNLKNKIILKNLLMMGCNPSFDPQKINIQTITVHKAKNFFNESKKFSSSKNLNQIKYLNNSSIDYNINYEKYYKNEDQILFFNSSESERVPSPIKSLNTSSHLTYTNKKKKQKRHQNNKIKIISTT